MTDLELLRSIPKVELHCHLEGSLRAATLVELARLRGVPLPSTDPATLYRYDDLTGFLAVYEAACLAVATVDDFARVTYEALEDAAVGSAVRYREMFWNPTLHAGLPYRDQLAGILEGCEQALVDYGIEARLIPSVYRQNTLAVARRMLADVVEHRVDRVLGIGLDGDEMLDPPQRFAPVFVEAGLAGLRRTAHAAHDGPPAFIETCLEELGCERVDHGYHVLDDPVLLERLRASGVPFLCASGTPPLCGWPTDPALSPIRRMIDAGLTVVLNSDDPPMLHTDLAGEYFTACVGWGLGTTRAKQFVLDAIDASWMDDDEKRRMRTDLGAEIDRMLDLGGAPTMVP